MFHITTLSNLHGPKSGSNVRVCPLSRCLLLVKIGFPFLRSRGTFSSKMNRVPKAFRKNFASAAGFQRLVLRRNCKWIGSWNMSAQFAGVCCLWALGAVPSYSLVSRLELSPRPLFPSYSPLASAISFPPIGYLVLALTEIYAASRVNSAWLAVHRCSTVYTWVGRIVCRRHGEPCLENDSTDLWNEILQLR